MWDNIISKTNECLPNMIRYSFIENKFIMGKNKIYYGELNYPIYLKLSSPYNIEKIKDEKYNLIVLYDIIKKTEIIKRVIDNNFFKEIASSVKLIIEENKITNKGDIYKTIQERLSRHISKEFNNTIINRSLRENNLIKGLLFIIKGFISNKNIDLSKYPYLNNMILNVNYIDRILTNKEFNFEIGNYINIFTVIIFTIIKNLYTVFQFITYTKDKSIFEDKDITDNKDFYYLSHFPFNIKDIKTIV